MRRIWKCVFRVGAGVLRTEQTQTSPLLPWSNTRKCIYLPTAATVKPVCLYSSMPPAPGVEAGSPEKRQKLEKMEVEQQEELVLRFTKLSSDAYEPVRGSEHAAGYDLFSNKDMVVLAKNKALVPTDIQIALPERCYGRVAPRSGLASKKFIDVGAGVIDRDYRGNVFVLLFNFSEDDFQVKRGDRIAQLICERICTPKLLECTTLDETKRGEGGFGSTGTN